MTQNPETTEEIASKFADRFKGLKTLTKAEYAAKIAEQERKQNAMRTDELRRNWNAPQRQVQNRANLERKGAWEATRAKVGRLTGSGCIIALIGTRGSGKTQLAVEAMFDMTERGHSARYMTAMEFFLAIKATFAKDATESEEGCLKRFSKFRLLVIDEIAKRGETDWENRLLFELIDRRYRDMRDTLVISNQSQPDFIASIGASLADRMNESGGILNCDWESFRQ